MSLILQALGVVWSLVVLVAAAVVVGTRRGLKETGARLTTEQAALIGVLQGRVDALVEENKRLSAMAGEQQKTIAHLQTQVSALRTELEVEKRITARISGVPSGPVAEGGT